jgi:hypothetical protein
VDQAHFDAHVRRLWDACGDLLIRKGADYAGSEDRLANFKRNADQVGLTPLQVWGIYINKHWDAIMTFVRTGAVSSEDIQSRFQDAINYLILGSALVAEAEQMGHEDEIHIYQAEKLEVIDTRHIHGEF